MVIYLQVSNTEKKSSIVLAQHNTCTEKKSSIALIMLEFNDLSTLVGHFVSSPREREKRNRRDSRRDERQGQVRKWNRNESEETEEIKTFPLPLPATRIAGLA